jgi:hypothetical protein
MKRKRATKLRHVNVMISERDYRLLESLTRTDDEMSSRTKTAIILRGLKLVAKELKQKEEHKSDEEGWD